MSIAAHRFQSRQGSERELAASQLLDREIDSIAAPAGIAERFEPERTASRLARRDVDPPGAHHADRRALQFRFDELCPQNGGMFAGADPPFQSYFVEVTGAGI